MAADGDRLRVTEKDLKGRLKTFLKAECPSDTGKVAEIIERLHERDAILVYDTGSTDGDEAYRFIHRTFQEYFAGCCLVTDLAPGTLAKRVKENPPGWDETMYLAIASVDKWTRESVLEELLLENRVEFAMEALKASRNVAG